jgi:hypothetical protein
MARDLNRNRDSSARTDGEATDATVGPRETTSADLASELAADAYNIVAALACLSAAYWVAFRSLPAELFTLGLVATGLVAVNVAVAVRRWNG